MLRSHHAGSAESPAPAPAPAPTATPGDALLPPYEQVVQSPAPPYSSKSLSNGPVDVRWSDISSTAAERRGVGSVPNLIHTVVPFTLLVLRIIASAIVLLVRLAGLSLSQLLGVIHHALARLDNDDAPAFGRARRPRPSTDGESTTSSDTLTQTSRRHRFRAASAMDESMSLQHLLRSARPHDEVFIHHHHHHHHPPCGRPDSRSMSESAVGLAFTGLPASSQETDTNDDAEHSDEVTPRQSSDSSLPSIRGVDEYEEPQDAFARKLARLALHAQAELDKRLARGEISADGTLSPLHDVDSESDSDDSGADTTPHAPEMVSFTSNDSSTPLSNKPMTVPLRGVVAPHSLSTSQTSSLGTDPSHWMMPLDQLLAPSTAPNSGVGTRRASAPASILQRSTGSSSSYGGGSECRSPSEAGSAINDSQDSSSTERKVKLVEPNWEPYVESHVRARARVQLNMLLQAARAEQGRKSLRNNLRMQALTAHAVHTGMHAQLHARAHTKSHDGAAAEQASVASDKTETLTTELDAVPMERARSSSFASSGSLGAASVSTANSSLVPPTEDGPQLYFESLFPGTAASKEWDFRKKPSDKGPPLDALADMLFDPMTPLGSRPGSGDERRRRPHRRSASSRILSRAGAASAVLQARTAGIPCPLEAMSKAALRTPSIVESETTDVAAQPSGLHRSHSRHHGRPHRRHHR